MRNKVNYIHAINFISLLDTPWDQGNQKNKEESKKMGLRFFMMNFHGCFSFILSQNANDALILDYL